MVGGGSLSLWITQMFEPNAVWLNDLDVSVWALWKATAEYPDELIDTLDHMTPNKDQWYEIKDFLHSLIPADQPTSKSKIVDMAAKRVYSNFIGYNGFGPCANGPYVPPSRRWGDAVAERLERTHQILSRLSDLTITCRDYRDVLDELDEGDLAFLDPPYFERGKKLYIQSFTTDDHRDLANCLHNAPFGWILTYGDHPEISRLYSWAATATRDVKYFSPAEQNEKTFERIITPAGQVPDDDDLVVIGDKSFRVTWRDLDFDHIKGLASSIDERGIEVPIFVDNEGHVIDGRDRLLAAMLVDLDPEEIPVRETDVTTESERIALRLLLQATHKGMGWRKKARYVQQLRDETGWSWPEIERQTGIPKSTAWRWVQKLENEEDDVPDDDETQRPVGVTLSLPPEVAEVFEGIAEKEGLTRAVEDAVGLLVDWHRLPQDVRHSIPEDERGSVLREALLQYLRTKGISEVA